MKNKIANIIYKILHFFLRYFYPRKEKAIPGLISRKAFGITKGTPKPAACFFIIAIAATSYETLWRLNVFRGGISA